MKLSWTAYEERWPLESAFVISRGSKREAHVVVAEVQQGGLIGRGECLPYQRYGEAPAQTVETIRRFATTIESRSELEAHMPASAARNAMDSALWDLEAKAQGQRAWTLAGISNCTPLTCAYTLPIRNDAELCKHLEGKHHPILKVKVGARDDLKRLQRVRMLAPESQLIVDANEGWSWQQLCDWQSTLVNLGVALIEQPLAANDDAILAQYRGSIPLCADESFAGNARDLDALRTRYHAVNLKLDKEGGLSTALHTKARAQTLGFQVMVGCMVSTSLAIAPAVILGQAVDWVDLDGAMFLDRDRPNALTFENGIIHPPNASLWG